MSDGRGWLAACGVPLVVALPDGVKMTALGVESGTHSPRLWLGLALLAAGMVGLECMRRAGEVLSAEARPEAARRWLRAFLVLHAAAVVLLQAVTLLKFALLLDGHTRLRACEYLYLAYAAGALLVLAGRQVSTRWGSRYLRWGWAPLLAFGAPLSLPALKAAGLVPFLPSR